MPIKVCGVTQGIRMCGFSDQHDKEIYLVRLTCGGDWRVFDPPPDKGETTL